MVKIVDNFSILNISETTFISTNGSSVIELCLISGPVVSYYQHILAADEYVELFTGAPKQGLLRVFVDFAMFSEKFRTRRLWMNKTDWKPWTLGLVPMKLA